ncbi:MAG: 2-octaprenyl-6-methoxyphenyl hydroxylase [Gammaproteobacteria bacterium]|nr:MAG: 2-octaprenyl-6-methoxyphenyl hydroxylase [Gammaproteobacteria bacterium]
MSLTHDVLIVGGGMVGGSLALALRRSGLRVGLIEARPFPTGNAPAFDDRVIALSLGSRRIMQGLGLWEDLAPEATAIRRIHVSDRGHFGATRIDCADEGVEALGYVAELRAMGAVLTHHFERDEAEPELIMPATLVDLEQDADAVRVTVERGSGERDELAARLLVAADGTHSPVRERLGIAVQREDYGQTAVIANVATERSHDGVAYERFTEHGPLAMLPMSDGRCSLVWTHRSEDAEARMAQDDDAFRADLQQAFGWRLGAITRVGRRASYPLALWRSAADYQGRCVLIGNAAHTLHPVAGQGLNLGLRDVAVLAELLWEAAHRGRDPGSAVLLARFSEWRRADLRFTAGYTDFLVRLFSNPWPPLAHARAAGLIVVDRLPPLRHALARRNMGLAGRQPLLGRGLSPLERIARWAS